jgi:hypothetical protein
MVDGEATSEQVLELRPHLRNCAGCRAALRELRGSNTPLGALFPVGGLALAGGDRGGRLDGASELLERLWDALWGDLSDRAATAAFRAQSMAQAILPTKTIATAASVAALAGGGIAVDEAREALTPPRAVLHAKVPSVAAERLTTPVSASRAAVTVREPAVRREPARRPKRVRRARRRHPVVRAARAAAASIRRAATSRAAAASAAPAAPAVRPAPQTSPAPPAAAPASSRPAGGAAPGEFGLEGH